jgi:tripartite-type tricarboxylate transporter receptor subunit TctC
MTEFPMTRRDALLLAGATLLAADSALAQAEWPRGQVIKFIVPFTAGSGTDVVARLLGEKLGPALGTSIVVDNRAGAGRRGGARRQGAARRLHLRAFGGPCRQPVHLRQPELRHAKDFSGITPLASLPNLSPRRTDS